MPTAPDIDAPGVRPLAAPSGISPDQGPTSGGTRVTITGTRLSGATNVRFGSRSAPVFTVVNDSTIIAVSPSGSGAVPVTVSTAGGTSVLGEFIYEPPPGLQAVRPGGGPLSGGNTVVLKGENLLTASSVRFGAGLAVPTVVSDQQLSVVVPPAAAPGTVPVTVITAGGVSNPVPYVYSALPTISGIFPASGTTAGGSVVVITGSGLSQVTGITVGGVPVTSFRANSDTLIIAVVPAGVPGPADVTVTTPGGSTTAVGAYSYDIPTTTTVSSAPDPSVTGQQVTITATVGSDSEEAGSPTGTVTFDFGDGTAPVSAPVSNRTATTTHTYASTSGSPHTINATYNGDASYLPSSGSTTHSVHRAVTATSLTSTPDPSAVGQEVTLIARVVVALPGAGNPTGTVTFTFGDGSPPATAPLVNHVATLTHTFNDTAGSPYQLTATYDGDADFAPSTSPTDTQTVSVTAAPTTTSLTSSPNPSVTGQRVTFTATVAPVPPATGTPTGTVTFSFRENDSTTVPLGPDGTATTTRVYPTTTGSPYAPLAVYNGDSHFSSSSGVTLQTVGPAATTTTVSSGTNPSVTGQSVTVTATIAPVPPGTGTPTGTVTFDFGDGTPAVTAPVTAGTATTSHTWTATTGSPYAITATYNGDVNFAASSGTAGQTVTRAATTTSVSAGPNPSVAGQPITVSAAVLPVTGPDSPAGTVTFTFGDGSPEVTAPVIAGVATTAHTYLHTSGSPYTITGTYSGDANFTGSNGTTGQTVGSSGTVTTVATAPRPSTAGRPVTVTVTVGALPPGSGAPSGTVTVDFGDGTAVVDAPLTGATAVLIHTYARTTGSPYVITAAYSGDSDFGPSSGTGIQTVNRASTAVTVAGAPDPSLVGAPVMFTATVGPTAGTGTPSGSVQFDFGDGTPPATVALVGGVATAQHAYTSSSGGPYTVTAAYAGDTDFTGSSGSTTQTVNPALTTTAVSTSPDPSMAGGQVTVTATVTPIPPGAGSPTGTVTFDFGDGTAPVSAPVSNGTATTTHPYASTSGSPYAVIATYNGDGDFTGSSGSTIQTVDKVGSTTTVSASPDPSVTGQPVAVTATVAANAQQAGAPTGTVTFDFGDGTAPVSAPVTNGTATTTHPYTDTTGSPYTITATYNGDTVFRTSSGTTTHTVQRTATVTTLTSTPDPSPVGQSVTLIARVVVAPPGTGNPSGTVTFTFGDGSPPATATLVNHVATVNHTYTNTAGSPYTVTAAYNGDSQYAPSSSPADTQTVSVTAAATSTRLTSSPNPSVTGQRVTFTATVTPTPPASGTPTGTVTFSFRDNDSTTVPLGLDGTASTTRVYPSTTGSPYAPLAIYSGDSHFSSSSDVTVQTVNRAATTTSVSTNAGPSVTGQPVTITATVTPLPPGAGAPSGTVTFTFGDGSPSVTAPVSGGTATTIHTWTAVAGSPYTVTATYSSDADFATSSGSTSQTVNRAATSTTVTTSPRPSVTGQSVTLTATVTASPPGTGTPTGTVTFAFGDGSQSVTVPVSAGTATTTHTWTAAAGSPYTVTASYNGDSDRGPSSGTTAHTVSPAVTSTSVALSPNPSRTGQTVTATATVAAVPPGAGTPSGTVTFTFGDGSSVTSALSAGSATATHAYTNRSGSPFTVKAAYNGSADFSASSGTATQTVNQAATSTGVTASPNPAVTGQPVTFTATVAAVSPGTGSPTGTVTFSFGDGTPAVTAPVTAGTATTTHAYTGITGSPYTVTAAYNGDTGYAPSSAGRTETVNAATTTTSISVSPSPATHTQPVTVTVTVAPVPPGAGTPTGSVTVALSGEKTQTVPLVSGTASVGYPRLNKGVHTVDVSYSGDTNYTASAASTTETVT
ncbi:Ig-like domain repeat protein [Streptomyces sp. NPDC001544]|uniref:Ig-like domain repeat protein n=1 Tax=Streptomyces sp. NPDC001544 TaxID=3364584 RepID=UPI0036CD3C7A